MTWGSPLLEGRLATKKGGGELCSQLRLTRPHTQKRLRLPAAKFQSPASKVTPGGPHRASGLGREALGGTCTRHSDCGADAAQVLTWPLELAGREQDRSPLARPSEWASGHPVPDTLLPSEPQGEDALPSCPACPWARKGMNHSWVTRSAGGAGDRVILSARTSWARGAQRQMTYMEFTSDEMRACHGDRRTEERGAHGVTGPTSQPCGQHSVHLSFLAAQVSTSWSCGAS